MSEEEIPVTKWLPSNNEPRQCKTMFSKWNYEDFERCDHCKAALQYSDQCNAWTCQPQCEKPTFKFMAGHVDEDKFGSAPVRSDFMMFSIANEEL